MSLSVVDSLDNPWPSLSGRTNDFEETLTKFQFPSFPSLGGSANESGTDFSSTGRAITVFLGST